jgi:septum formation protein
VVRAAPADGSGDARTWRLAFEQPAAVSRLVLASASPARLATLRAAGIEPEVVVSGVDESVVEAQDPAELVLQLARLKAQAVVRRLRAGAGPGTWVLGCDSVLALDGQILGKPGHPAEAVRRWRAMRGRSGVLHTGHCLVDPAGGVEVARSVATTVHFVEVTDEEIAAYVATGEPLQVAGAFTLDGLGGAFVSGIEGDHHNVVGLSLPVLREMFAELGVRWTDLWRVSASEQPTGPGAPVRPG